MAGNLSADAYEELVGQSVDLLTVVDDTGRIEYKSPAAERLLDRDPAELVGENVFEDIHPEDRQRARESFEEIVGSSDGYTAGGVELRFRRADGSWVWLESRMSNRTGSAIGGYVISSRDVTERKAYERELERERDRLERFASFVSHDLRNPLNVAEGRVELLRDEYDDEGLDAVARALDRMNELIEDALALVDERETEPLLEAVDLAAVVETCWESVRTEDATLDVRTDQWILADESQLRSLLENLFRNAVEHGGGDVTVTAGALDGETDAGDGSASDTVGFYVEDDGRGFRGDPETALEYGFSTNPEGSGLGLSIVTEVVENHDWRLRATESATGGARFEVTGVETIE